MIRLLIVCEIRLYREGLAQVLDQNGFQVVGSLGDRHEVCEAIRMLHPDVVLLDMGTQGSHDAVSQIRELAPGTRVVALGIGGLERDILSCAEAGVAGYVPREGSLEDLVNTIHCAVRGEFNCSPQIGGTMLRRLAALSAGRRSQDEAAALTPREGEILRLIDDGCSNKDIAKRLGIELATVKNHVHNLLEKLHVHRRGEAAAQIRRGFRVAGSRSSTEH